MKKPMMTSDSKSTPLPGGPLLDTTAKEPLQSGSERRLVMQNESPNDGHRDFTTTMKLGGVDLEVHVHGAPEMPPETLAALRHAAIFAYEDAKREQERGCVAWHRIISDECRKNHGDFDLPIPMGMELQKALFDALQGYPKGKGTRFHLKLIIEHNAKRIHGGADA